MELSITERVPVILCDTEGRKEFWSAMRKASSLTETQGQLLVMLARRTLEEKLNCPGTAHSRTAADAGMSDPALQQTAGIFVTLKAGGLLRGCIGTLVGQAPLVESVRTYAVHAAFDDPRFSPLTMNELNQITIEVSVLTRPKPLAYTDPADLVGQLRRGVDGVILRKGLASATFLPQVWEQLPKPEDFLTQLCLKAGLPAESWRTAHPVIETYQVQHFEAPAHATQPGATLE